MTNDASINYTLLTFNNFVGALFTIFQIITMDSWTNHMYNITHAS